MGKQWPVKPPQKCRAGSIPAFPDTALIAREGVKNFGF